MNHDLVLDRDAFALWESGGLSAHLDLDGLLGAQRGDTLTMHKQRVGPFDSDREKNAPRPDPLTFEVTYVSRVNFTQGTEHGVLTIAGPDLLHVRALPRANP